MCLNVFVHSANQLVSRFEVRFLLLANKQDIQEIHDQL